ncbi:unnamed protein product [Closterium sp. NIES-54]
MAGKTGPLTDLLHKDRNFVWGEEAEAAFQELKKILVSPLVLRMADPSRPFEVITDASDFAIGAVLLQDFGNGLQPIAYESRKLQAAERNYPIHDKEMLAIIHAFKQWRCYLVGADVTVRTDHKSLQYLRAQPNLNPRQIRWLEYMESHFTYRITYKKGANNIDDALTRPTNLRLPSPSKLRPRFCVPFKIIKMVIPVTAKLLLPDDWRIHDAFHVSLLRKFVPATTDIARQQAAPTARPVPEPTLDPSKILAHRVRLDAAGRHVDFLIRWTDRTSEDDTWVSFASLAESLLIVAYLACKRTADIDHLS